MSDTHLYFHAYTTITKRDHCSDRDTNDPSHP
jgi:hypothetical protein